MGRKSSTTRTGEVSDSNETYHGSGRLYVGELFAYSPTFSRNLIESESLQSPPFTMEVDDMDCEISLP